MRNKLIVIHDKIVLKIKKAIKYIIKIIDNCKSKKYILITSKYEYGFNYKLIPKYSVININTEISEDNNDYRHIYIFIKNNKKYEVNEELEETIEFITEKQAEHILKYGKKKSII